MGQTMEEIRAQVRRALQAGATLREIAEAAGVSVACVSRTARGLSVPAYPRAVAMAQAAGRAEAARRPDRSEL